MMTWEVMQSRGLDYTHSRTIGYGTGQSCGGLDLRNGTEALTDQDGVYARTTMHAFDDVA